MLFRHLADDRDGGLAQIASILEIHGTTPSTDRLRSTRCGVSPRATGFEDDPGSITAERPTANWL